MKNGITLVPSKHEDLKKIVNNYQESFSKYGMKHNLVYLEDLKFKDFKLLNDNLYEIIYLLNNHQYISTINNLLTNSGHKIINSNYLKLNYSKIDSLLVLKNNGFEVPNNVFSLDNSYVVCSSATDKSIVKSLRHGDFVGRNINKKFKMHSPKNFSIYHEKFLDGMCYKAYFIKGEIFFNQDINFDGEEKIRLELTKLLNILQLDISSVDFFIVENKLVVIDVNFSPGFYRSKDAITAFCDYVKKLLNC